MADMAALTAMIETEAKALGFPGALPAWRDKFG